MIWDLWSIRMVGPKQFVRVRHGRDVYEGRSISLGGFGGEEKMLGRDEREALTDGGIKTGL